MILLLPILLPLFIGLLILFYPGKEFRPTKNPVSIISLLTMLVSFVFGIIIFAQGKLDYTIQLVSASDWAGPGIGFDLVAYHFSSFILLATLFFGLLITIYSFTQKQKNYFSYFLLTIAASSLAILSNNLVVLLLAWGAVAILLFLLINLGKPGSETAANKALVMVGGSDILMLVGAAIVYYLTNTLAMNQISIPLVGTLPIIAFILLLIGALTKAGAMPFHSWIPDSAEYAPVPVMALLPASLDKLLGIYLLARISLDLFKVMPNSAISILMMVIGSVTIVAAVSMALLQKNLLKLLSFHAVSQVGYMVLGIGTGIPLGIIGGLFHMVNNAIYKSALFLGAGAIENRTGQTSLEKLGGLARYMPITFITCLISALAISGIPPLNGFVSKWLVYQGVLESTKVQSFSIVFLLAAMFGSVLTLASFLKVLHSTFLGEKSKEILKVKEAGFGMVLPMVILAALSIVFGVFAQLPIRYLIGPILGETGLGSTIGIWNPTLATGLILIGLVLGFLVYRLRRVRKVKISEVFIGGETISPESQAIVSLPDGGETMTGVVDTDEAKYPGTYFYDSIKKVRLFDETYRVADNKFFDLYEQAKSIIGFFVRGLKKLHTG
ncbi:MAG: proton-conducting transporter membrane subunit, partial [candidate division WOR-3 bacterium]|nr:proton-conducting transporter membrane subunit [candidate division WOR-3 bacterium]